MDWKDLLARAGWTAAQSGLAVVVASGTDWIDPSVWAAAAIVAVATLLSVVKTSIAQHAGGSEE